MGQHQLLHEMENSAQCLLTHSLEQHIWNSLGLGDQQVVMDSRAFVVYENSIVSQNEKWHRSGKLPLLDWLSTVLF